MSDGGNRGFPPGYPPGYYGWPPHEAPTGYGWYAAPYHGLGPQWLSGAPVPENAGLFEGQSGRFILGLLLGAGATYLLTNEGAQQAAIRTAVRGWQTVRGGVEELKERFRDAEAELAAE